MQPAASDDGKDKDQLTARTEGGRLVRFTGCDSLIGTYQNITVTGCTLISTSAAIKFGSESEALFRNIIVENCVISRSNRGISLQLRDPGSIENVLFHNIIIGTIACCISLSH